ncbi:Uu.00g057070.m01.CDS01 [Anthostomella pinea]|uniref:Uu.00g057070.m01.CDS01 n=1 Tax=Anthostomella pinea TaxID=933095 RepID=A0AAI8VSS4_9PEZI|nr:Uu.00g057070.m01.CDS01 [Anthostomella pinea]
MTSPATYTVMKDAGAQWQLLTEQLHGLGYGFSANALKHAYDCATTSWCHLRGHEAYR